tara:strand:+ start:544 stop:1056 length:513 start_codon:yes stop_codon:yes gene_type:complete
MARRASFGNSDFSTWINNIKSEVAEEASEAIIRQLQIKGPYWTGNFAGAWEARVGNVNIPADQKSLDRDKDVNDEGKSTRQMETYVVEQAPKGKKGNLQYTIDNRMEYRDVAKDLVPDSTNTIRGEKPGRTAPLNWYRTYLEGGGLQTTLALATNRVAKKPEIKNFRGTV